MKFSPTLAIVLMLTTVAVSAVVAQETRPQDVQTGETCHAKAVKHLLAATDPTKRVDQEWNLRTAEAYQELAAMGYREC